MVKGSVKLRGSLRTTVKSLATLFFDIFAPVLTDMENPDDITEGLLTMEKSFKAASAEEDTD